MKATMQQIGKLVVLLVKPSKYDDTGHLLRFWKGVLPSNTLAVMNALTQEAFANSPLAELACAVHAFDELVWAQRVKPHQLVKHYADNHTTVVAALVGVQTNQFPRACDLAEEFIQAGAKVVIGGFHVSGSLESLYYGIKDKNRPGIPCPHIFPPEIQALIDKGVIVCAGEAEELWGQILTDIVQGQAKSLYHCEIKPQLITAPLPRYPDHYFRDFAVEIGTLDTGRGCPFKCDFCTIINVQGRDPRWRDPQKLVNFIAELCHQHRSGAHVFFVDDNFARNPKWEAVLDGLIELQRQGLKFTFMVEIDLASGKIKCADKKTTFVEKLGQAGCVQAFVGMESVNPKTLQRIQKNQNNPEQYQTLCEQLHQAGITVHGAYIIGFDEDDYDSVIVAVRTLRKIGVDQVSFFCLTPLPGSESHVRDFCKSTWMDTDFNRYDSFQPVTRHPLMTEQQWCEAFRQAGREFYRSRYMIEALRRCREETFWGLMRNYMWYRNSLLGHKIHPMICGLWQIRTRRSGRRHGYSVENRLTYGWQETKRIAKYLFGHCIGDFYLFQHVYYQAGLERKLDALAAKHQIRGDTDAETAKQLLKLRLNRTLHGPLDWLHRTFGNLPTSRVWLNAFWRQYGPSVWRVRGRNTKSHVLHVPVAVLHPRNWLWHLRMIPYAITEVVFTVYWSLVLLAKMTKMRG